MQGFYRHLWSVARKLGLAGLAAWAGLAGWVGVRPQGPRGWGIAPGKLKKGTLAAVWCIFASQMVLS